MGKAGPDWDLPEHEGTTDRVAERRPEGIYTPSYGEIALRLLDNGYEPVPLVWGQKRPAINRWNAVSVDIVEFRTGAVWEKPDLPDLCETIETSKKPVIAAIAGPALGGALEVALACDYRVATPDAVMGLPEIKLGLLPGARGTQRLPRIAGLEAATRMILSGDPVKGDHALSCGLVDALFENDQDFRAHVLDFATGISHECDPKRSCADMIVTYPDPKGFLADFRHEIAPKSKNLVAPERCLTSIEAACDLPLAEGLAQEKAGFAELLETPQSRAGRHLFFAERECPKVPGVARGQRPRDIAKVAVIGAGTMGRGIAIAFLQAGYPVTLLETTQDALEQGLDKVSKHFQRAAEKGRLSVDQAEDLLSNVNGTHSYGDLADTDLIIEAAFENMDIKRRIFEKLDRHAKQGAVGQRKVRGLAHANASKGSRGKDQTRASAAAPRPRAPSW